MKISLKWLSQYIEVSEFFQRPEGLSELLTSAGLEVENIENQQEQFRGVVIGQILELGTHPNADRLTLCKVDLGNGNPKPIVCGAKNHRQGDKVVVALPGAVLPGDFHIKKSKIRGEVSEGMLCSDAELALSGESAGIRILPADAPVGTDFSEYAGLNDVIFELSVTPNRADCLSHWGLARELSCLLNRPCHPPKIEFGAQAGAVKDVVGLELVASDLCPRYAGRAVIGVKVASSPEWLRKRLEAVGVNSINNVVDVTNFVMLELGQPLHAFDADKIAGPKITIDLAKEGEAFQTLDGTELKLAGTELMIRDADRPVALAGVVGGLNSGTTEATTTVFIESAHFTPETVRKTSRKYGIDTDSGYRFSRGTDPEGVLVALDRAAQLIQELAGGKVTKDAYDLYPTPIERQQIEISLQLIEERLGYAVKAKDFEEWMKRLGCEVKYSKKYDEFKVLPPPFRWDLFVDVDLIEEYARLNGYDKIPENLPALTASPADHDVEYVNGLRLTQLLTAEGYLQAVNYNFISEKFQSEFLYGKDPRPTEAPNSERFTGLGLNISPVAVRLVNPLSDEIGVMRTSLAPGLFKNALHNYRHGSHEGRLFEVGHTFSRSIADGYEQFHHLGLMGWGQSLGPWEKDPDRPVVYDLKSSIENLLASLKSNSYQWRQLRAEDQLWFLHPGQSVTLFCEGRVIGYLGTLHPEVKQQYKIRHDLAVAEFDVQSLMRGQPRVPKIKSVSKYPAVERDLALLMPEALSADEVLREIRKIGQPLLQSVRVFDVYCGENLPEKHRSVAFRMVYQDSEKTMTEEDLTGLQDKLIKALTEKFPVQVR